MLERVTRTIGNRLVVRIVDRPVTPIATPMDLGKVDCIHDMWATKYRVRYGKVTAVGNGVRSRKTGLRTGMDVRPGDIVSFAGLTKMEDGDYVMIVEKDVLTVEDGPTIN